MITRACGSILAIAMVALLPAAAQQTAPAAAPAAGSPAIYLQRAQLEAAMQTAMAKNSDLAVAPIGVTDQYSINEVHRGKAGPAALHVGWTELHVVLEGSGTFVTGGNLKDLGAGGKIIEGGVSRKVAKGDAVIVPANTPHWYQEIDGSLQEIEVRFIAPGAPYPPK